MKVHFRFWLLLPALLFVFGGCGLVAQPEGAPPAPKKAPLYERLGADVGITKIVDDFVGVVMTDPHVNFTRKGVPGAEWNPTDDNVKHLKEQMVAYISRAVGGPGKYSGKSMHDVHRNMQITAAEFDAAMTDLKQVLDQNRVAADAQRELLEILEKTQPNIVTRT